VEAGLAQGSRESRRRWEAADHKHFTITREFDAEVSPDDPFFLAQASWLDGSHQHRIGWKFKTFEGAVRLCSIYTRVFRRQVAYHEAGHAVTAWLLGFSGVWIDMEDGPYRAVTRHDLLPSMLAVADGGRDALARYLYEDLMFTVAGTVAEETIAGYRVGYVEVDTAGRTSIDWDAVRVARIEAGLPVCGHKDCEIPFATSPVDTNPVDAGSGNAGPVDVGPASAGSASASPASAGSGSAGRVTTERVTEEDVAEVTKRAKDEVFAMLTANWPVVQRVVNMLCKQDRITSIEFDALMAGPKRAGKYRRRSKRKPATMTQHVVGNGGPNIDKTGNGGSSMHEPSMPEPTLIGDAS
jgi:hypothetical protein